MTDIDKVPQREVLFARIWEAMHCSRYDWDHDKMVFYGEDWRKLEKAIEAAEEAHD